MHLSQLGFQKHLPKQISFVKWTNFKYSQDSPSSANVFWRFLAHDLRLSPNSNSTGRCQCFFPFQKSFLLSFRPCKKPSWKSKRSKAIPSLKSVALRAPFGPQKMSLMLMAVQSCTTWDANPNRGKTVANHRRIIAKDQAVGSRSPHQLYVQYVMCYMCYHGPKVSTSIWVINLIIYMTYFRPFWEDPGYS